MADPDKEVVIYLGACEDVGDIEDNPSDHQLQGVWASSPQTSVASSGSSLDGSEGASFQGAYVQGA